MVAGAGRKVYGSETLSSAEVQAYLMDQAVMQFDSDSARTAQLPSPQDGNLCYRREVDRFEGRVNGAWVTMAQGPGVWQTPALTGRSALGSGYSPPRYRLLPAINSLQIIGMLSAGSAATLFTLPVGYRPVYNQLIPSQTGASAAEVYVMADGTVPVPATGSFLAFSGVVPLD